MKSKHLAKLGIPRGTATMRTALRAARAAAEAGFNKREIKYAIGKLVETPEDYADDPLFGELAASFIQTRDAQQRYEPRKSAAPYRTWGSDLDTDAVAQMERAVELPIAVSGALLPDAHVGYGLPIGGVLAVENAVIPYAVGMDIACRMRMSVLDIPYKKLGKKSQRFANALEDETRFGVGASFRRRREHKVMDADWKFSPFVGALKDKAWAQLGTSGSGNHFVEFGLLTLDAPALGLEHGEYLALLSHSGSRGAGGQIAQHFSKLAMHLNPQLPRELLRLAWFALDSAEGREYWEAMQLMGRYAAANHELVHQHIARNLGAEVLTSVENHHNFAWIEEHDGREVVVHRKGATPAGKDVLGVIPGSMTAPGFVVRGKGNPASLHSASHGAGRAMSRKAAKNRFTWKDIEYKLKKAGVTLLSAGVDEAPMAYKDIHKVMDEQQDLVDVAARFEPKLVKMARE